MASPETVNTNFKITRQCWDEFNSVPANTIGGIVQKLFIFIGLVFMALIESLRYPFIACSAPAEEAPAAPAPKPAPVVNSHLLFLQALALR